MGWEAVFFFKCLMDENMVDVYNDWFLEEKIRVQYNYYRTWFLDVFRKDTQRHLFAFGEFIVLYYFGFARGLFVG